MNHVSRPQAFIDDPDSIRARVDGSTRWPISVLFDGTAGGTSIALLYLSDEAADALIKKIQEARGR